MGHIQFKRILSGVLMAVLLFEACAAGLPALAAQEEGKNVALTDSRSGQTITFSEDSSVTLSEGQSHTFSVTAAEADEYWLAVCYRALPGRQINPEASFTLTGGGSSFSQSLSFSRRWVDIHTDDRFQKDSNGNEVLPKTQEESVWQQAVYGLSADSGSTAVKLEAG